MIMLSVWMCSWHRSYLSWVPIVLAAAETSLKLTNTADWFVSMSALLSNLCCLLFELFHLGAVSSGHSAEHCPEV